MHQRHFSVELYLMHTWWPFEPPEIFEYIRKPYQIFFPYKKEEYSWQIYYWIGKRPTCRAANRLGINAEQLVNSPWHFWETFPSIMQSKKSMVYFFSSHGRLMEASMCFNMPIACHLVVWSFLSSSLTAIKSSLVAMRTPSETWPHMTSI